MSKQVKANSVALNRSIAAFRANVTRHEVAAMLAETPEQRDRYMRLVEQTEAKLKEFARSNKIKL